jgi:hypothetical protein
MAWGAAESDAGYAAGRYVTWHSPRSTGAEGWEHVLDLANGAALVATWRKPVVSDEPIGAAGEFVGGRRDNAPDRFAAAAALSRLAGLHPTFHYEAGLQARIPADRELECFEAWRAGLDLVEDLPEEGRFLSATELGRIATVPGARAAFGRQFERTAWVVAVDADASASVTPGAGWRVQQARRLGRLLVARLERV